MEKTGWVGCGWTTKRRRLQRRRIGREGAGGVGGKGKQEEEAED